VTLVTLLLGVFMVLLQEFKSFIRNAYEKVMSVTWHCFCLVYSSIVCEKFRKGSSCLHCSGGADTDDIVEVTF
jgi:hypothetical protein